MKLSRETRLNIENMTWDYCVDVLIIGTGFAGLSAAIELCKTDQSVLIIEKMKSYGGNSIISDGGIAAPGTDIQKKFKVEDCEEWMIEDMFEAGLGLNQPELLKTVVYKAREAFYWTRDTLQVPFLERIDIFGGHRVARCYTPEGRSGATILRKMIKKLQDEKVPIQFSTSFQSFVTDETGSIIGAIILEDFNYKTNSGKMKAIQTNSGIILASGGFAADVPFRSIQDPRLTTDIQTTNKLSATAEGLQSALAIGAASVQLSHIQLGAWASPDEHGYGTGPLFADYIVFPYGIIVDPKTGSRFVNELSDRKQTADALLKVGYPCIGIADELAVKNSGWDISKNLDKGIIKSFTTIEELAITYQMDTRKFMNTLSIFNQFVRDREDKELSKPITPAAFPIEQPPFYAMRLWPKTHYTMGGLAINSKAQVLDFNGNIIEGLYAAGEVVGGVHGASRLGSCAITECIVFGRIAGKEIVSNDG